MSCREGALDAEARSVLAPLSSWESTVDLVQCKHTSAAAQAQDLLVISARVRCVVKRDVNSLYADDRAQRSTPAIGDSQRGG